MAVRMLQAMRELRVPIEVQRERIGVNMYEQLTGNGKAPELIEGEVVEAELNDNPAEK